MVVVGAAFLAPLVVLVRRPGWGPVADSHPDADRLADERDAVRARAAGPAAPAPGRRGRARTVLAAPATGAAGAAS